MFKIVKREEMAEGTVILNEIEAPLIAKKAKPGQFVILKANEDGERIPLTMADTDTGQGHHHHHLHGGGQIHGFVQDAAGGRCFQDVIGPLGKPTHLEKVGKVVCVGGGTGVAVLHPITRALKEVGNT
jgi:ferredoxin--NADP+ reductase